MKFKIPKPLTVEHEELHAELVNATEEEGPVGVAARAVAELLHPHFVKEEEYALPPLGLLSPLVEGQFSEEMKEVLRMTDQLAAEFHKMMEEHKEIVKALEHLGAEANKAKKYEYVHFTEKLMRHAQTEEEVLYPAAILVGEYIKAKLRT